MNEIVKQDYILTNGIKIPKVGFGTWLIDDQTVENAVIEAVKAGYRHIDTAQAYQNEEGVGRAIKQCGLKREELFITSKVAAEIKDYQTAVDSINESLKKLDVDYIDLMLIHCPQPWSDFRGKDYFEGNREVWTALEEFYEAGKIKAIGVSNFEEKDLENIINNCKIKPMVNQILVHIGNTPKELIKYCYERDILVEGYSPIAHGKILQDSDIMQMAAKYHVSVAQLCIRYNLELGLLPLPKSANPEHIKENVLVDFEIKKEDMAELLNIDSFDYEEYSCFACFRK